MLARELRVMTGCGRAEAEAGRRSDDVLPPRALEQEGLSCRECGEARGGVMLGGGVTEA